MECPYCQSSATTERSETTTQGYRRFRCRACARGFNERTGAVFNRVHYLPDVVCLVVVWRAHYKLSLRGLAEIFLERGVVFTHEAVREWEAKLARVLSETFRKHRRGKVGCSWYCDETYLKVRGRGVYLYRATDRDGNLVDVLLSERQDQAADSLDVRIQEFRVGGTVLPVYDEVRHFFRARSRRNDVMSLAWQRALHVGRMRVLMAALAVA